MKQIRLFVCFLALFVTSLAQAQTEKGNSTIGGNFGYTHSDNERSSTHSKSNMFDFNPGYSYFVKDNFALGFDFDINYMRNRYHTESIVANTIYENLSTNTSFGYGIGLTSQNYVRLTDQLSAVFRSRIGYAITNGVTEFTSEDPGQVEHASHPWYQETTTNVASVSINPGLVYFVNPKLGLQCTFGGFNFISSSHVNETLETDNENTWSSFAFNLNDFSSLKFGLTYFF